MIDFAFWKFWIFSGEGVLWINRGGLFLRMGAFSRKVLPVCGNLCKLCPSLRPRSRQAVKRYKKLIADIFPPPHQVRLIWLTLPPHALSKLKSATRWWWKIMTRSAICVNLACFPFLCWSLSMCVSFRFWVIVNERHYVPSWLSWCVWFNSLPPSLLTVFWQKEAPNERKIGKLCDYAAKNALRIPEVTIHPRPSLDTHYSL